jgi:hypothetical protein
MMKTLSFLILFILLSCSLFAQKKETITVKAGTKIIDYFPGNERYLYPDFTKGKCILNGGRIISGLFNYNLLTGEMNFIKVRDTLAISDKKTVQLIVVAVDTFYYQNYCMQLIKSGRIRVYRTCRIEMVGLQKQGALGSIERTSAVDAYDYVLTGVRSYNLKAEVDEVFQKKEEYFFSTGTDDFVLINKKNALKMVPGKENELKNFIKSNKINFELRDDILKLTDLAASISR